MHFKMMRVCVVGLCACLLADSRAPAWGGIISEFNTDQQVVVSGTPPGPLSGFNNSYAANSIGQYRTISLDRLAPDNTRGVITADSNITHPGYFSFSTAVGVTASTSLIFDGQNNSATINPTGLGGVDLTEGGSVNAFLFSMYADHSVPLVVTAYTDATHASTATINMPVGTMAVPESLLFSAFTPLLGSGANFNSIGALVFTIDGSNTPSVDAQIDIIATGMVPEPSSVLMLGIAAAGLPLVVHRTRRLKAALRRRAG